ncbi:netrin-4 isoform X1 [Syngnathus scovelli]|uniref:netrin-4 isoform X1 n=2 Tax=Syngnathus scovelli TaxID=161590 RepID=UPI002110A26C|nr:netrin-4 isoform X1 [Syngnathus scovelli]
MFGKGEHRLLLLIWMFAGLAQSGAVSRCAQHACGPPVRNLATGRALITLSGSCGNTSRDQSLCPHPASHMTDDPFLHPNTFWESSTEATTQGMPEEIRLDLETHFCLSHVVLSFRSPRPAAMMIERSTDFGKSWDVLKVFADNCSVEFGLPDDFNRPGSLCTSRDSSAAPCSGGEVILRILDPNNAKLLDPYSPEALTRMTLTNLRIRLLKAQICPLQWSSKQQTQPTPAPYAVYNLLAQGTCLCHGHAEHCEARRKRQNTKLHSTMVSGRCVCTHHTAGLHCEKCAPLYNDRPWKPANGSSGEANQCQKCECHEHADSCHFSRRAWLSTGGLSGGVCDGCRHNTFGRRCQRCRHGYRRHPNLPINSPHTCQRCWCDHQGSLSPHSGAEETWCHPRSGQCKCKTGVGGTSCTHCMPGYWGFGSEGCKACSCPNSCNPTNGKCLDSHSNNQLFNIPIGGKIPALDSPLSMDEEAQWPKEQAVSVLHSSGKCICKEKKLKRVSDLCKIKHDYAMKAIVVSAHDKGSHAEVRVKVRKVLRSGLMALSSGTASIFPVSWTSRGCTCPILNPGMEYLLAGPEESVTGRLLVTMQSAVVPWTPRLGLLVTEGLRRGCP